MNRCLPFTPGAVQTAIFILSLHAGCCFFRGTTQVSFTLLDHPVLNQLLKLQDPSSPGYKKHMEFSSSAFLTSLTFRCSFSSIFSYGVFWSLELSLVYWFGCGWHLVVNMGQGELMVLLLHHLPKFLLLRKSFFFFLVNSVNCSFPYLIIYSEAYPTQLCSLP